MKPRLRWIQYSTPDWLDYFRFIHSSTELNGNSTVSFCYFGFVRYSVRYVGGALISSVTWAFILSLSGSTIQFKCVNKSMRLTVSYGLLPENCIGNNKSTRYLHSLIYILTAFPLSLTHTNSNRLALGREKNVIKLLWVLQFFFVGRDPFSGGFISLCSSEFCGFISLYKKPKSHYIEKIIHEFIGQHYGHKSKLTKAEEKIARNQKLQSSCNFFPNGHKTS